MRVVVILILVTTIARAQPSPAPEIVSPFEAPVTAPVAAPREKPVGWAAFAGLATALVPLAVGGALSTSESLDAQVAGSLLFMSGLTLAPLVAHGITREWGRGALFAGLPATAMTGMVWLLAVNPHVLNAGNKEADRYSYAILVAAAVLSSGGGVVDALWANERVKDRERKLTLVPFFGAGQVGLALGGSM